jgi:hypothetical protein
MSLGNPLPIGEVGMEWWKETTGKSFKVSAIRLSLEKHVPVDLP